MVLGDFFSLNIQNRKDVHKISFSETAAFQWKFAGGPMMAR